MHNDHAQAIVHRDIKSAKILLDSDFQAKIVQFGLARMLVKSGESEFLSAIGGKQLATLGPRCESYLYNL